MLICGLTLIVVLKQIKPEYSFLLRFALVALMIAILISQLENVISLFYEYTDISEYSTYLSIAIKILGICYISQTGADICRDCSESTLATQVEFLGRISVVMASFPIIKEFLDFSLRFISDK